VYKPTEIINNKEDSSISVEKDFFPVNQDKGFFNE